MAASLGELSSKDHLLCSICLDVFTHPVTAPCGHNFCRDCITGHWTTRLDCPVCTQLFPTKPQLRINSLLSQMVHQFRNPGSNGSEEVLCDICTRTKVKAVKSCVECLTSYCQTHLKPHWRGQGLNEHWLIQPVQKEVKMKTVQQFAVDLTLDPDTAHPWLILSEDGKQVHCGDQEKNLPDDPGRFSYCVSVLAKESFSSGRFYFEVQVKGKTEWDLGIARESINRKGRIRYRPGRGFWMIFLRNRNEYKAASRSEVRLPVRSPLERVGVFVNYDEGLVSFYDADSTEVLYTFTRCCFRDQLRPLFSPCLKKGCLNSAPLIICPVDPTS